MRKKNRKRKASGFAFPVPFAGVVVFAVLAALAYVWLEYCSDSLGSEMKALERQKELLHQKHLNEEYKWMQEKSPRNIMAALKNHHLVMTWPTRSQVVRLQAPSFHDQGFASMDAELLEPPRLGRIVMND